MSSRGTKCYTSCYIKWTKVYFIFYNGKCRFDSCYSTINWTITDITSVFCFEKIPGDILLQLFRFF